MSINIDGQFNLTNFTHGFTTVKGKECIIIPLEDNHLKKTEKGNVLIFWKAWPFKDGKKFGENTHSLKHSVSKEVAAKIKEDGKYPTDLGFLKAEEWKASEPAPNSAPEFENASIADDLPF